MEHGALAYHECVADDAPVGKRTSFPRSVKLKEDEVVVFAYIVYTSRAHRDKRAYGFSSTFGKVPNGVVFTISKKEARMFSFSSS